jgi:hypothetical protein
MLHKVRKELRGKSHYFDADTIRWFSARYGSWRELGGYVACVESTAKESWGIPRRYRVTIVRLDDGSIGHVNAGGEGCTLAENDWPDGHKARAIVRKLTEGDCARIVESISKNEQVKR